MKKFTLLLSLLFAIVSVQAQDYLINFAGTGASTNVGTVKVENLTQGTSLSLSGSEVLHLVATGTGTNPVLYNKNALHVLSIIFSFYSGHLPGLLLPEPGTVVL